MTTGKTITLTRWTFVGKVMSLLLNMLSSLVIAFLPGSKRLLISWLKSLSAVIWSPPKKKVSHCFHCFPIYLPWSGGTRCHDLSFLNVVLTQLFHSPLSLSSRGSLVLLHFLRKDGAICISEVIDVTPGNLDSCLCFIQPGISHDAHSVYKLNKQGGNI